MAESTKAPAGDIAVSADLFALLRCPLDPSHTALTATTARLVCQRCALVFPVRDGFLTFLVEEAELPPGCNSLEQLPCQREKSS
jgi:uncharacterized protein